MAFGQLWLGTLGLGVLGSGGGSSSVAAFLGNPYVTITAIDVSGGIASSRTSGEIPLFIQVSASAITATGTTVPYEDLEYSWNFGDAAGVETFTNPGVGGGTKNANSDQVGPEAAYVYRSAGSYTITLTVRGKNGGAYTTMTKTLAITASAFTKSGGEFWADSNWGGSSLGTFAAPYNTAADIQSNVLNNMGHKALHVKAGSDFEVAGISASGLSLGENDLSTVSGFRMDKYGSGADPIFRSSSGAVPVIRMANNVARSDIVISNIKFTNGGTHTGATLIRFQTVNDANNLITNVYLDNCTVQDTLNINIVPVKFEILDSNASLQNNRGLWGCAVSNPSNATNADTGIYGGAQNWWFVFGGSISGAGQNNVLSHHIYPQNYTHSLYKWIDFGNGVGRNFCINTNHNSTSGSLEIAQYVLISGCNLTGTERAWDASESNPNNQTTIFRNFVADGNNVHDLRSDGAVTFEGCDSMTVRNCNVWNLNGGRFFAPGSTLNSMAANLKTRLYGNKMYYPSGATAGAGYAAIDFNAAYLSAQVIRGNIIQDMRTTANCLNTKYANFPSNGSYIDANQYYAPNDSNGSYLYDSATTEKTLAQNNTQMGHTDTYGNPNWSDPANGVF